MIDEMERMFYNLEMENLAKLKEVSEFMYLEPAEEVSPIPPRLAPCGQVITSQEEALKNPAPVVHNAVMPGGKTIPLLKTMLTTACERNCNYCPFRAGRNYRRINFKPEEMAQTFMTMYRAGVVEGIFLSSGIIGGGVKTQDKLIETADILRHKHKFRGYLHLKIMPGSEKDQVRRSMELASRLSVNLEAPNDRRLADLAPKKVFFEELLRPLQWVEEIRQTETPESSWNGRWPSTTTQFVVGAVGESDLELLSTSEYLYKHLKLARTYFMAFNPVLDTPLENTLAENPLRQNRLYQASFLFRDYGFDLEDMPFTEAGNLPLDTDPKLAWAQVALRDSPVEVNRAEREELLRIPGIGPKGAAAILAARRRGKLREVGDLQAIGVATKRLKPFVLLDGKRPTYQLPLL
ncbi:MAG: radical SAM protein [Ardenticatenaceae bacterium]|nr:radical SAM protein [Ardenticatenaceae bacterium]